MAEPKNARKTIYNTADGPRSVIGSDGMAHVVPAGGSVEGEFSSGELGALHPDLTTTKPKDAPEAAPAPGTNPDATADAQAKAVEELATQLDNGNTRPELLKLAEAEKVEVESDDNKAQLALKIAQARLNVEPA